MKLKLLFKENKAYLAAEQDDIIENVEIIKSNVSYEIVSIDISSEITLIKQQLILEIKFDGVVETIPSYIESTITEVPQQTLLETKKGDI